MTKRFTTVARLALVALALGLVPAAVAAQTAQAQYAAAKTRDDAVRSEIAAFSPTATAAERTKLISEARSVIAAYEALVRRSRASGYADNSLYNAATLAEATYGRFSLTTDLDAAIRLHKRLSAGYPTAALAKDSAEATARLSPLAAARTAIPVPSAPETTTTSAAITARQAPAAPTNANTTVSSETSATTRRSAAGRTGRTKLTSIDRVVMPQLVRITLALDREVPFREETLAGPARLFFDFSDAEAASQLADAVLRFPTDVVRLIRVGRHPSAIRVVLDLEGVSRHSVYTLYNPFRIVIDAEPSNGVTTAAASVAPPPLSVPARTPPPSTEKAQAVARPQPPARIEDEKAIVMTVATDVERADRGADSPAALPAPATLTAAVPLAPSAPPAAVASSAPSAPNVNTAGGFRSRGNSGLASRAS